MATVRLDHVTKFYGAVEAIHDVNFQINDGEFLILVGPSGCGKSTLLRMIAGLEEITDGEVSIDGRVVNDVAPKERDIAMVFQHYALYPHMTVEQNMGYSLRLAGIPKPERARRVREAADILALSGLLERRPKQLSGGQRQRVAMGRAIVRDPKVFLFDEPLSNLDAKLRVAMRAEIKTLQRQLNTTTIYVTHDQIEAMTMGDRIVVLNDGRVEQVGTPLQLYDTPCNLFVASFIGSPEMNLFSAEITANGDGATLAVPGVGELRAPNDMNSVGGKVVVGIRPEDFRIAQKGEPAIEADIMVVEPTGAETHVGMHRGSHNFTAVFRDRISAVAGDKITIAVAPEKLHLFDQATGERMAS